MRREFIVFLYLYNQFYKNHLEFSVLCSLIYINTSGIVCVPIYAHICVALFLGSLFHLFISLILMQYYTVLTIAAV